MVTSATFSKLGSVSLSPRSISFIALIFFSASSRAFSRSRTSATVVFVSNDSKESLAWRTSSAAVFGFSCLKNEKDISFFFFFFTIAILLQFFRKSSPLPNSFKMQTQICRKRFHSAAPFICLFRYPNQQAEVKRRAARSGACWIIHLKMNEKKMISMNPALNNDKVLLVWVIICITEECALVFIH